MSVQSNSPLLQQNNQVQNDANVPEQLTLLDTLSKGAIIRRSNQVVYANPAILKLIGLSETEKNPLGVIDMTQWVYAEDLPLLLDKYEGDTKNIANLAPYNFRLNKPDGSYTWVSCTSAVIKWQSEDAILNIFSDISTQMEQDEKAQFDTGLFKSIFNVTPEFMMLFRLDNDTILDINPSFLNIFGHRREDVLGVPAKTLNLWPEAAFHERFTEELKTTGSISEMPTTMNTRGNVIRHFRLFARRVDNVTHPFVVVTGRDITDEMSKSLELQRNRDAAELASRSKSEFLANMSHELRTPLNAILGFSELIRDQIGGPDAVDRYSDYAHDIHRSGHHLLSILNDILDISKVEAGRLEAYLEWIDPKPSLSMCLKFMQQRASEAGVQLVHTLDPSIRLYADDRLFRQICLNLLSNAVKFTDMNGHVQLSLTTLEDGHALLKVEDNGIGMTQEDIDVAKRPFGQVDSSLSRKHDGSGLGLPLVVSFAEKLGCEFGIESKPGEGTTVRVIFPASSVTRETETDD